MLKYKGQCKQAIILREVFQISRNLFAFTLNTILDTVDYDYRIRVS